LTKLNKNNVYFFIGLSLLIVLFDLVMVNSALYSENDRVLTIGVSLDFIVVIPLLLYFLIFRKANKSILSMLPFALLGYLALILVMPEQGRQSIEIIKYFLIPLELAFVGYGIYKIITHFRSNRLIDSHPIETMRNSMDTALGSSKISSWLVHDLSVWYYAFFSWRKKPYVRGDSASFSYHTESNWLVIVMVVSKLLIMEGAVIHILLMQWSHLAAWILSLGNLYIVFALIADYRAMRLNPILVSGRQLRLQYGIQMTAYIDMDNIESVTFIKFEPLTDEELKTAFTPIAIEPNVLIRFKSKVSVIRLFGMRQHVDRIYVFVDKPREFQVACREFVDGHNEI